MMSDKIISLAQKTGDASFQTPEMALKDALDDIGKRGAFKEGKKLLILCVDQGEKEDKYEVSFIQAGMKMSECLALCEVGKTLFLEQMEYINP